LKTRKKRKFKRRYFLLADLVIVIILFVLLLYKPARYDPLAPADNKQVSSYLTHELMTQLYNGAQRNEPFDLVVMQEGINDVVTRAKWPIESGGTMFYAPAVLFTADSIVLMGTAAVKGVEFIVTIVIEPKLDEKGLLNLQVTKVKVGAMNITLLARMVAKKMYQQRLATTEVDTDDLGAQIAASLLSDEPFEPVFTVEDKKVRAEKITITQGKVTLSLVPAPG